MSKNLTVSRKLEINATPTEVWQALTDPAKIKEYMFGADATVDLQVGGKITYAGEFHGKKYEDTSEIIKLEPQKLLQVTHSSNLSSADDTHIVTYKLQPIGDMTLVTIEQDNVKTEEQVAEMGKNWEAILKGLKKVVENKEK